MAGTAPVRKVVVATGAESNCRILWCDVGMCRMAIRAQGTIVNGIVQDGMGVDDAIGRDVEERLLHVRICEGGDVMAASAEDVDLLGGYRIGCRLRRSEAVVDSLEFRLVYMAGKAAVLFRQGWACFTGACLGLMTYDTVCLGGPDPKFGIVYLVESFYSRGKA